MIELFSGIGAQKKGIDNTGLYDCEVIATADIEKDAIVSYATIHNELTDEMIDSYSDYPTEEEMKNELIEKNIGYDFKKKSNPISRLKGKKLKKYWLAMKISKNLGDISKIKELPAVDFWTYSFPCTDISLAGKQEGIIKGKTRSGLLYEVERLLGKAKETDTLPKYLLLENVKNLVGKKFIEQFNNWIQRLDEFGFNTYWKVINAKNCGVPQNRERVFAVSIRKDIDTKQFEFMKPFDLGTRLRDFLEEKVDEKYYLSREMQDRLVITDDKLEKNVVGTTAPDFRTIGARDRVYQKNGTMGTLMSVDYKQPKQILEDNSNNTNRCIQAGNLSGGKWNTNYEYVKRYYSQDGVAPTISTCGGGQREPKVKETVKISQATKQGYIECEIGGVADFSYPDSKLRRGRVQGGGNICPTLTSGQNGICRIEPTEVSYRVRKLTPRECYRLMGFSDTDFDKTVTICMSNSALYKQAGNSIVTNCIALIMEHLYKAQYDNDYVCTDEIILENFTKPQAD